MTNSHDHFNQLCSDPIIRHQHQQAFHCPECLPASKYDDRFGSPHDCPEILPTHRFSSPTTELSTEEFEKLKACIHEINDLLLTLGVREDETHVQLRMRLQQLHKQFVRITVKCEGEKIKFLGGLKKAGRDFVHLNTLDENILIPNKRICSIDHEPNHDQHGHEPELINIDRCFRRDLVLRFGEVVSGDPSLINLFFGISLSLFLVSFIGCDIQVSINEEEDTGKEDEKQKDRVIESEEHQIQQKRIMGCLIESEESAIQVKWGNEIQRIQFEDICFIKL
ncbi:hypothetical protein HNR44_001168 [Geomicrobium halophilum]|uniref:Uncharacterized protein n=1 Tax=Geomicrobium halophilum TaxID=549000 RepID=A0A841PKF7_9BACL|nr:hypothetical protein [Geomicrobium halophilum]MBB6449219.1 hypothetical protein [Geomicrobium halophilum]